MKNPNISTVSLLLINLLPHNIAYVILGIVAIILGFNIVLVIIDTFQSLYEVFQYIRRRGLRTFLRSLKNQYKLKIAK
jgi:hypothetical protein